METIQEIVNAFRNGDPLKRQDVFLMYRYFRREFMAIEQDEAESRVPPPLWEGEGRCGPDGRNNHR